MPLTDGGKRKMADWAADIMTGRFALSKTSGSQAVNDMGTELMRSSIKNNSDFKKVIKAIANSKAVKGLLSEKATGDKVKGLISEESIRKIAGKVTKEMTPKQLAPKQSVKMFRTAAM